MEAKLKRIREELDELGYYQVVSAESTPLVEKLVADLKTTTESLQKYMKIAQRAIEERDNLQLGAEPFRCDNARLVKECNDLHLQLLRNREENEQIQKDLKRRVDKLKTEILDCNRENQKLRDCVRQLEVELVEHGEALLKPAKTPLKNSSTTAVLKGQSNRKLRNFELNNAMALADQKISNLTREIKKLKDQNLELTDNNQTLQSQCKNRDKEINRLNVLLEGGRPQNAINKDCTCKHSQDKREAGQIEIERLVQEKFLLESRLKDALAKQHEAMKRALHLAERNKMLEKEMKDIDHLALAVEAECNSTVANNAEKVHRLQERVHCTVIQIQNLERDNAKLRQEKQELNGDLDAIVLEKKHLQTVLETSLDEKKRLTDKLNNFTIIEHDLNMEIDRLMKLSADQKRKIAELENSLVSEKSQINSQDNKMVQEIRRLSESSATKSKAKGGKRKVVSKIDKVSSPQRRASPPPVMQVPVNTPQDRFLNTPKLDDERCRKTCCDACGSAKHLKELLDKELDYKEQQNARCIDNLKAEKDYYMREYHKILEQNKNVPSKLDNGSQRLSPQIGELMQKLAEKEQSLASLQHENKILSQEKFSLMTRLETVRDQPENEPGGVCSKINCKRMVRERELLRNDVSRLEEEIDALKQKIKNVTEAKQDEEERLKKMLQKSEEQVLQLEHERREVMQNQGSRRATINGLEEQCETAKNQLRAAQSDLNHQRALYTQLKTLHEQTDRALSDTQGQLIQVETELASALDSLKKRDHDRGAVNKEVDMLRKDMQIMRTQLAEMDKEKDDLLTSLDEKTERVAFLELDIRSKDNTISALETAVEDLKKKLNMTIDENASQDLAVRSTRTEVASLRQELESLKLIKDNVIQDNRRLQDDLAAATCDCRDARNELDRCKRQVEDLKTQLQHYVAEVKRTEDLISNKEIERNELLDQFRSLSQEANALESNNHTLENEASQAKVQLSVALDHAGDLERKLDNQEAIVRSYEKQIGDLTRQMASLEMQAQQATNQFTRAEEELNNIRELCLKLDMENQRVRSQLREREDERLQIDRNVTELRHQRETMQHALTKDKQSVESMERIVAQATQESTHLRMVNQDLQEEVQKLNVKLQDLHSRFIVTSEQLDMYQEKALEYSQQIKQLRREVANEKFRKSRDSESNKYPSL